VDFKILFSDQALNDLSQIVEYVLEANPDAAERLGRSLLEHVKILQVFPYVGPLVDEPVGVRKLLHTPYKIYYRVHSERKVVEIDHIWHGARLGPNENMNQ
jgi:plasmid stabilization system protein ParE